MYDPATKVFDLPQEAGTFQTIGTMDTMPDAEGIGLFNGDVFGIYIGSGDVILASETLNCVAVEDIRERSWTYWMLFEGIQYPESVTGGTE